MFLMVTGRMTTTRPIRKHITRGDISLLEKPANQITHTTTIPATSTSEGRQRTAKPTTATEAIQKENDPFVRAKSNNQRENVRRNTLSVSTRRRLLPSTKGPYTTARRPAKIPAALEKSRSPIRK